jgi:exonuclease III
MKIATFNINNVNKRLANLLAWLRAASPDVVCLQELKSTDADFPIQAIRRAGYDAVWRGQKTWNGVAILARGMTPVLTRSEHPDRLPLRAERQPAARTKIRLQARLARTAEPARQIAARGERAGCARRRLQCRADAVRHL